MSAIEGKLEDKLSKLNLLRLKEFNNYFERHRETVVDILRHPIASVKLKRKKQKQRN